MKTLSPSFLFGNLFFHTVFPLGFMIILLGCQGASNDSATEVKFIFGPDDSGTLENLVSDFNKAHKGKIKVVWTEGSRSSDAFNKQLVNGFTQGSPDFDAFAGDVIWTASFAQNEWVEDLTDRFFSHYQPNQFVKPAMESASYQYRIWGVPWFTDTGLLFYRKDLLKQIGASEPQTWDDLRTISKELQEKGLVDYGFVFQGAAYEGGVTNLCEYIWNAGGDILLGDLAIGGEFDEATDPEIITVKSEATLKGLQEIKKIMDEGVAPNDVFQFRELDAGLAFREGKAAFMRSWPSSYGLILDRRSDVKPDQVGIAPIPTSNPALKSYSCLGGWNLMINATSSAERKDAAWTFFKFLLEEQSQRYRAENGGMLPSLRKLYYDTDLLEASQVVAFAKEVIADTHERPKTPYYTEISQELATIYNQVLIGVIRPSEAVDKLDNKLKEVLVSHQANAGG